MSTIEKISILPKKFPGIEDSIYAGFWRRFGAFWLDFLFWLPLGALTAYINNISRLYYLYTFIPTTILCVIYYVWCVKRWGGTPGKLIAKVKIVRKDGKNVGWNEAILRYIVPFSISLFSGYVMYETLGKMTDAEFLSLGWVERTRKIMELNPELYQYLNWTNQIWVWSEFIVLLTNKRKRALHDFIAGTVVIKKKYEEVVQLGYVPDNYREASSEPEYKGIIEGEPALSCVDCEFSIDPERFTASGLFCPQCGSHLEETP